MVTFLYLLIGALACFVIGYLICKAQCDTNADRYLSQTPVDSNTHDNGSCEEESIMEPEAYASDTDKKDGEEKNKELAQEIASEPVKKVTKTALEKDTKKPASVDKVDIETKTVSTAQSGSIDAKTESVEQSTDTKPIDLLDAPRDGKKDNITRIKGIGLKIEESLNAIGVYHFDQIAAWTEENIAWVDSQLSFRGRANREDWIGQAKLLAEGKETEFSKRVDKGEVSSSKKD